MAKKSGMRKKGASLHSSKRKPLAKSKRRKTMPTRSISKSRRSGKLTFDRKASHRRESGPNPKRRQSSSVVRIMGQGQYKLDSATVGELNKIDNTIVKLVEEADSSVTGDLESRFKEKLADMVSLISSKGKEVDPKEILASDFILPPVDATIEEAKMLFKGEGLIPE